MDWFVTDLDKVLDDFEMEDSENAKENVFSEIYDSSGYISLRTSSVLSSEDATLERHTPVPIEYDSNAASDLLTPTKEDHPLVEDQDSYLSSCIIKNTLNNVSVESLNNSNCTEVISNQDYSFLQIKNDSPELITDVKELIKFNEEVDNRTLDNDGIAASYLLQDPPKKKCRPNSLIGLCSVVAGNLVKDQECRIDEESQQVEKEYHEKENNNINKLNDDDHVKIEHETSRDVLDEASLNTEDKEIEVLDTEDRYECFEKSVNESEIWQGIVAEELGIKEPMWINDSTSDQCMECQMSFTMFRRRHHCRACGRLLCNKCCSWRIELRFNNKLFPKDRVCATCFQYLIKNESLRKSYHNLKNSNIYSSNNDKVTDKSSTSPNLYQRSSDQSPSGTMSSSIETSTASKSVIFSDGIILGGDLTEFNAHRIVTPTKFQSQPQSNSINIISRKATSRDPSLLEDGEFFTNSVVDVVLSSADDYKIFTITKNLHVHLHIIQLPYCTCMIINEINSVNKQQGCDCDFVDCWFFFSVGLETIGIEEVVFVLKKLPEEVIPPIEIFKYYFQIYERAFKNETKFDNMEMYVHLFDENNTSLKDWAGILHIRPSFQSFEKLPLLPSTFLVGIMVHRMELIWAILLPLRLILALGNQSRFYPCSIVSDRERPSVYGAVGQTIIQILVPKLISPCIAGQDLSNMIPPIPGMWLHLLPSNEIIVQIPKFSYNNIAIILSSWQSKRAPLPLVSAFSLEADSHLVCCQDIESGKYYSGAINIQNTERNVTGATMILLVPCKNSEEHGTAIVEDIIVVKLSHKQLGFVINSLKTVTDIVLQCGPSKESLSLKDSLSIPSSMNKSIIKIVWTESRQMCDMASITRPSLVSNETIQNALDYLPCDERKVLKSHRIPTSLQSILEYGNVMSTSLKLVWTRYHMIEIENTLNEDPVDFEQIIHEIAYNFALSIIQFLDILCDIKLVHIGLRVKLGPDIVEWLTGCAKYQCNFLTTQVNDHNSQIMPHSNSDTCSNNTVYNNNYEPLPEICLDYIKEVMVPFLYSKTSFVRKGSLMTELEFHIIN